MAKLIVREGRGIGAEHEIPTDGTPLVLGRSSASGVQILDSQASRSHARVEREGSRFLLRDLNSSNGTRLNGRLVKGQAQIKFGDKIRIGETVLQLVPEREEMAGGPARSGQRPGPHAPARPEAPAGDAKVSVADKSLPAGFADDQTVVAGREDLEKAARARDAGKKREQAGKAAAEEEKIEEAEEIEDAEEVEDAEEIEEAEESE